MHKIINFFEIFFQSCSKSIRQAATHATRQDVHVVNSATSEFLKAVEDQITQVHSPVHANAKSHRTSLTGNNPQQHLQTRHFQCQHTQPFGSIRSLNAR